MADWFDVIDGAGTAFLGHAPSPVAERLGEAVRLTIDADQDNSPVIELPATEMHRLLTDAERDLIDLLRLAAEWAARHLPDQAGAVIAALARALDSPAPLLPGTTPGRAVTGQRGPTTEAADRRRHTR